MPPKSPNGSVFRHQPQVQRIDLDGAYAGAWVELILNPPASVVDLMGAEMAAMRESTPDAPYIPSATYRGAIACMVRAWNWADATGQPLPPTAEGLAQLDWDSITAIVGAWGTARALPKSSAPAPSPTPPA